MNPQDERYLEEVRLITTMMREHQKHIADLSKKRAAKVMKLREHKVTYREIAEAMGTTEQSVYNIIRGES
jgi:predicted transcriptional regulator